ncbi:hypothetical protein [Cerasicoccus maritimus]|uniref:hypothetical protein n=1 Tax=Cerasicoccus maritimus TaxID=490089 RepID=UPI002852C7FD|nr:hypothetical protein [Cerasicoccus maritimus]
MPKSIPVWHKLSTAAACAVFSISLCISPAIQAAPKKETTKVITVDVPDETLLRFMSPDLLREWRRVERGLAQAKADVESGEWLEAKEYSQFVPKSQTDSDRKRGKEKAAEGRKQQEAFIKEQNKLRQQAYEAYTAYQAKFDTQTIVMDIEAMSLDDAINKPTEALLYKLWNENYSKIYLSGIYVFRDGKYTKAEQLSEQLSGIIGNLDGNRYSYVDDINEFTLGIQNGRPQVDFESREDTVKRFKPALLIAEVLFDAEIKHGLYALNAYDLKTGDLIEQTVLRFPVVNNTPDTLGIDHAELLTTVEHTPAELPETTTEGSTPAPEENAGTAKPSSSREAIGLSLVLEDQTNFLGRLGKTKSNYAFDVNYVGQIDGFDQRTAILLNNALMRNQGIKVDDIEFLTLALPMTNEGLVVGDIANAEWRVSPISPVEDGEGVYSIRAQAKTGDQTAVIDIGTLTIQSAGETIPPQAKK